jgi:peptidylprolyl isomerase
MQKILIGGLFLAIVSFAFWYTGRTEMVVQEEAKKMAANVLNAYDAGRPTKARETGEAPAPAVPEPERAEAINSDKTQTMQALLKTSHGDITIEFSADAPNTVANFKQLASEGFYNGTKFHRVIKGFMIQGGDPLTKDDSMMARWGTGGPGYQFADEIHANNRNEIGTIAMANAGSNTNGSQFFINVANNNFLDSKHTVFGKVISGMDVVAKIENTATGAGDRPVEPMVIESITLK